MPEWGPQGQERVPVKLLPVRQDALPIADGARFELKLWVRSSPAGVGVQVKSAMFRVGAAKTAAAAKTPAAAAAPTCASIDCSALDRPVKRAVGLAALK